MASPQCTVLTAYASGTNAAGATVNGTSINAQTYFSIRFTGTITNGGTAPTIPCQANLQISEDNSNWYTAQTSTASLTASATTTFDFFRLYPGAYVRVQITGNTAQSVTYAVVGNYITAIA
jgi:hypothetical protein